LAERWAASNPSSSARVLPFAAEAAWITGKWDILERLLNSETGSISSDFNVGIGKALLGLRQADTRRFESILADLRVTIMSNFSSATTASLAGSHANTLKLHALFEITMIGGLADHQADRSSLVEILDRRIELLGAYTDDKQYLLGIRRATMHLAG
jgi:serine/threonine-protein kinase ATR